MQRTLLRMANPDESNCSGLLCQLAILIFAVETVIFVAVEFLWPFVRQTELIVIAMGLILTGVALLLYWQLVKPLDRQLAAMVLELKAALRKAETLASADSLTGLLNRRTLFEQFERERERAERYRRPLSCIMIDIDHFKAINDIHGHLAGDAALVSIAETLRLNTRKCDLVERYGGEEFCIVLPETQLADATEIAERLRKAVAAETDLPPGRMTASFGVAEKTLESQSVDDLVMHADQNLFAAKRGGRNCVVASQQNTAP